MTRPMITAALITLNEAANLTSLLPALDWVDEIVLVDSGSTDETLSVAERYGCRVSVHAMDTFAQQRNRALELARGDWVLSIDADERPTAGLVQEIRRTLSTTRSAAFRIPIRSTIFGRRFRRSGTQDDRPIRLFRRESARWDGDVHEVLQVRGRVGRMHEALEHHTLPDLDAFLHKMHRYTWLEAHARVAAGRAPARGAIWWAPLREVFRRLIWKQGFLDGLQGWSFCLLSGLSEWVLAERHRRLWQAGHEASTPRRAVSSWVSLPASSDSVLEEKLSTVASLVASECRS